MADKLDLLVAKIDEVIPKVDDLRAILQVFIKEEVARQIEEQVEVRGQSDGTV